MIPHTKTKYIVAMWVIVQCNMTMIIFLQTTLLVDIIVIPCQLEPQVSCWQARGMSLLQSARVTRCVLRRYCNHRAGAARSDLWHNVRRGIQRILSGTATSAQHKWTAQMSPKHLNISGKHRWLQIWPCRRSPNLSGGQEFAHCILYKLSNHMYDGITTDEFCKLLKKHFGVASKYCCDFIQKLKIEMDMYCPDHQHLYFVKAWVIYSKCG